MMRPTNPGMVMAALSGLASRSGDHQPADKIAARAVELARATQAILDAEGSSDGEAREGLHVLEYGTSGDPVARPVKKAKG